MSFFIFSYLILIKPSKLSVFMFQRSSQVQRIALWNYKNLKQESSLPTGINNLPHFIGTCVKLYNSWFILIFEENLTIPHRCISWVTFFLSSHLHNLFTQRQQKAGREHWNFAWCHSLATAAVAISFMFEAVLIKKRFSHSV